MIDNELWVVILESRDTVETGGDYACTKCVVTVIEIGGDGVNWW